MYRAPIPSHPIPQTDFVSLYFNRNLTIFPLSLGPNRCPLHFPREPALLLPLSLSHALSGSLLQSLPKNLPAAGAHWL